MQLDLVLLHVQREMLLPISGKKDKEVVAKSTARPSSGHKKRRANKGIGTRVQSRKADMPHVGSVSEGRTVFCLHLALEMN
jgi:hypothetical protein